MREEIERERGKNEKKFSYWVELQGGGRKYWYDVVGKFGFKACYVKEVDEKEETVKFYQEIYENKKKNRILTQINTCGLCPHPRKP
jgi:hypothetical protein